MSEQKPEIGQFDKKLDYLLYVAPGMGNDFSYVCFWSHGTINW